ncbi:LacI family DNA-binding transcriptional regulator [Roseisalinus antarcticus]|uniref:Catabolite control protein A n=1 Tax=Roseisalinus antarcticus TaxID=254357 RepID=A0A1Y5S3C5_9RHOB|nr:LacI family DNA-binding transcriptional regulator [Roseisalinus antarcticus]SLN29081.1 Catabolite control protein A [Roseisalinus antarcticus]
MARRPTLKDVAREADVSIATVNRAIKGTPNVREETVRKVSDAAHRIGYHGVGLLSQRLRTDLPEVRLGFVLHKQKQAFYQEFAEEITRQAAAYGAARCKVRIVFLSSQSPGDVAAALREISGQVDAVAATSVNHQSVTDAVAELHNGGTPCFALLSDFGQGVRTTYIGLNNLKIGRGAARMLSVASRNKGKLALFVGGYRWHGHELRETGFRSFFREHPDDLHVLDTLVNLETRQLTYEATLALLARHGDLAGLYVAGGGMEGAIAALREERAPGQVALVVNELTPESRRAIIDGYVTMIIRTPLATLCHTLVGQMAAVVANPDHALPGQTFLDPVITLPEFL